jgi:uncharacterized protein (TIGR03435 family)
MLLIAALGMGLATAAQAQVAFDVGSVKENKVGDGHSHIYSSPVSGNFRSVNVSIKQLLSVAYDLPETQILGVTGAVGSTGFDLEGKVDAGFDEPFAKLDEETRKAQKRQMLQGLLKERFKLACHTEKKDLPIYALVVGKTGSKLEASKANGRTINGGYGKLSAQGMTMDSLAQELAKRVGRPVSDKTGIAGRFDVTLRWTPEEGPAKLNGSPIPDPPPDIFTAIGDQLGLKLEATKGPVDVLVVDHLEMPELN